MKSTTVVTGGLELETEVDKNVSDVKVLNVTKFYT